MEMGGSYEYYWEMQHLIEFEELSIFLAGDAQDDTLSCYDSSSLDGSMSNSSWAPAPVPKTVPAVADGKDAGGKAVAENRNIVMERDRRQKLDALRTIADGQSPWGRRRTHLRNGLIGLNRGLAQTVQKPCGRFRRAGFAG
ncbi:unnamed protein product [Urochloa humidicola]